MALRFTAPAVEIDPNEVTMRAVLECDQAFADYVSRECRAPAGRPPPVVRASTYAKVDWAQDEFVYGHVWKTWWVNDPRRPVVMKGARRRLIAKFSHSSDHIANGYCKEVAKRYLRRVRYTCSDPSRHGKNIDQLEGALRRRHHCSYVFDLRGRDFFVGPAYEGAEYAGKWVDGSHVEHPITVAKAPAERKPHSVSHARRPPYEPRTRRTDERAILRAIYELGLVKEGDTL